MSVVTVVSLLAVLGLVAVHLFSNRLRFLDVTPRSIWLSIAGGISVAYVFVHLLPELAEGQETVAEALDEGEGLAFLQSHIYLIALLGLAVFYGLERLTISSRRRKRRAGKEDSTSEGVFWLHISSFAVYNFLIGYLFLHRLATGLEDLLLFFVAMALHFVVNDHGLREHHKEPYLRRGRWILAAGVILGWVVALLTEIPEVAIAVLTAFLAGGVIMNVLKEELPEERESRFWAFALGAALYTAVLLAL
jgi:zinc transporter ZupT